MLAEPRVTLYCAGRRANGRPCNRVLGVRVGPRLLLDLAGRQYWIGGTLDEVVCEKCRTRSRETQLLGRPGA